ncbi:MAG TPA: peptidoglycan DD-metalloendopeptidase family protein [Bacteroidia bacterium]|nr:peptidoglycan DD-metalloendopeptidase family protein [Bacteroidia bacterium]HRH08162.1 peptidoglycan DD-metalloendopeptidase family protein [Bacteroidia bacterium]
MLLYNLSFSQNLILNGNFSTTGSWVAQQDFHYGQTYTQCPCGTPPCTGYAYLSTATGGSGNNLGGSMEQFVTIPVTSSSATLSFCWNATSTENISNNDFLVAAILMVNPPYSSVTAFSTSIVGSSSGSTVTYTLTNPAFLQAGMQLDIDFEGSTNGSLASTIRLDDVSFTYVPSVQYGSVNVTLNPSGAVSAGAQWNIDGGSWQSSGTTLNNISTGIHTINFNSVSGWTSPTSQNINVTNGNTNTITGTYTQNPQYGSVNVTLSPSGAISVGAQWNIDGGSWQSSGTTLNNISTGSHTINFNSISGWTSPTSQNINVTNGNTSTINGTYTQNPQYGSVNVTLNPPGAISAGALWNIDGGSWQNSGATLSSILTGNHTINFNSISGWTSPTSQNINVTNGNTSTITGTYTQNPQYGSVNVILNPSGAVGAGAQWNIDGGSWQNSGTTLNNILTGNHTINFNTIASWTSPSSQNINVTNGNTTSVTGTYSPVTTTVTVTSPNGGENWQANSNHSITGSIAGSFWGYSIFYSSNNGSTWNYVTSMSSNNSAINFNWSVPNDASSNCKIKVEVYSNGSTVSDMSNSTFTILTSAGGTSFNLDPTLSHLFWPFPSSSWNSRNGWKGAYGGPGTNRPNDGNNGGSGHAQGGHDYSDYFADDWNDMSLPGNADCHQPFYSPISGTVIYAKANCTGYCYDNCSSSCCGNGFGNSVVIQSDIDGNYAFRISHFYQTSVTLGTYVNAGDLLGELGMTGYGTGAHAHCALYKNINLMSSFGVTGLTRLNSGASPGGMHCPSGTYCTNIFASDFIFDATVPGSGGGQLEHNIFVSKTSPICSGDSIILSIPNSQSYLWNTGDTTQSITVKISGLYSVTTIDTLGLPVVFEPVSISIASPPSVNIYNSRQFNSPCIGDIVTLSVLDSSQAGFGSNEFQFNTLWSTGSPNYTINVTSAGWYSATVTDTCGNSSSDSIYVFFNALPLQPTFQVNGNSLACNTSNGVTYQWSFNGLPLMNDTLQYLTATTNGYYAVSITDNLTHCSSTSIPTYVNVTGIENLSENFNAINIHPNPTEDILNIEFELTQPHKEIMILLLNSLGQQILSERVINPSTAYKAVLDIAALKAGVYQLQIILDDGATLNRRVIIQK